MCDYFGIANGMLQEFGTNNPVVEFLDKEEFGDIDEISSKVASYYPGYLMEEYNQYFKELNIFHEAKKNQRTRR